MKRSYCFNRTEGEGAADYHIIIHKDHKKYVFSIKKGVEKDFAIYQGTEIGEHYIKKGMDTVDVDYSRPPPEDVLKDAFKRGIPKDVIILQKEKK